jgi:hypothetical protein
MSHMDIDEILESRRNRVTRYEEERKALNKETNEKIKVWPPDDPRLARLVQKDVELQDKLAEVQAEIEQIEASKGGKAHT